MKEYINFFDIGAAGGIKTSLDEIALKGTNLFRFFGLEPNKKEILKLKRDPYEKLIEKALSGKGGKRDLHITKDPYVSSLLEPKLENIFKTELDRYLVIDIEKVDTVSLNDLEEIINENPHWLKIDTQGLEGEIITNYVFNDELVFVILELSSTEQYKGQILMNEVFDCMKKNGFDPLKISYKTGAPFEHDVYFIKRKNLIKSRISRFSAGYAHLCFGNTLTGFNLIKSCYGILFALYLYIKLIFIKILISLKVEILGFLRIFLRIIRLKKW